MKKYFKFNEGGIHVVSHKNGGLFIVEKQYLQWFSTLSIKEMKTECNYTECTREECEAAYKQTIQFLNDKINGN